MPRLPRIDIPGLLHHVIFRGIAGCPIVKDDADRQGFVSRLGHLSPPMKFGPFLFISMDPPESCWFRKTRGKIDDI